MEFFTDPTREAAERLLAAVELPTDDLDRVELADFVACGTSDGLVGLVGLEIGDGAALLRSLAVAPARRGTGLGRELVRRAEVHARSRGAATVYLLTETAERFFRHLGYERRPRDRAPPFIRGTAEYSGICPASAAFMAKSLGG